MTASSEGLKHSSWYAKNRPYYESWRLEPKSEPKIEVILQDQIANALGANKDYATLAHITEHFRNSLGGELEPDIHLRDLRLQISRYSKNKPNISKPVKIFYGRAITSASRAFETVGELREATYKEILSVRGIGIIESMFLFYGFQQINDGEA